MNYIRKIILKIPAGVLSIVAIALDLYLSLASKPVPSDLQLFEGADKVVHLVMYLLITLAFLYDYTKYRHPHHTQASKEVFLACVAMVLGLILEALQLVMSMGRSFEAADIVADCLGAVIALLLYRLWISKLYRKFLRHRHRHHHHKHRR